MRCPNCGEELEAGSLFCLKCGQEVQIVPDYDPFDEMTIVQENPEHTDREKQDAPADKSREKRETKKEKNSSKIMLQVLVLMSFLVVCFVVFLISYFSMNQKDNYSYQLKQGIELVEDGQYEAALPYLRQAQGIQENSGGTDLQPLCYLARAYAATGAKELAVNCMKAAIRIGEAGNGPDCDVERLYAELMDVLNQTKQTEQIETVIENCKDEAISKKLEAYRIEKPSCNTPEGTYPYYLSLELEAQYGEVYYTLDGTEPTAQSTLYEAPIELTSGETLLRAVAVNKKGIVSNELVLVYKLEFQENPINESEEV